MVAQLEAIDYVNMGEASFEERYWFKKGDPRKYNVHLVGRNNDIVEKLLLFRDALRKNSSLVREYEALKRKESSGENLDGREYAMSKNSFVQVVLNKHR